MNQVPGGVNRSFSVWESSRTRLW